MSRDHFLLRSNWSYWDKVAAIFAIFASVLAYSLPSVGRFEGKLAPVVTGFNISDVAVVTSGKTEVHGTLNIDRLGCVFNRLEWYLVGSSREALVGVEFKAGSRVRETREQHFGPWIVDMSSEALLTNSRVIVFHQCPKRPWLGALIISSRLRRSRAMGRYCCAMRACSAISPATVAASTCPVP